MPSYNTTCNTTHAVTREGHNTGHNIHKNTGRALPLERTDVTREFEEIGRAHV
jgi:hypothetical protein